MCLDAVLPPQLERKVQRGMNHSGARVELNRYAGSVEKEWIAESQEIPVDPVSAHCRKKAHRIIKNVIRSGETVASQFRSEQAVLRGAPGVQSFGHGAAIGAQTCGERAGDAEGVTYRSWLGFHNMGACGGGAEDAKRARGMYAVEVMTRVHSVAQPASDLHADDIGFEERCA